MTKKKPVTWTQCWIAVGKCRREWEFVKCCSTALHLGVEHRKELVLQGGHHYRTDQTLTMSFLLFFILIFDVSIQPPALFFQTMHQFSCSNGKIRNFLKSWISFLLKKTGWWSSTLLYSSVSEYHWKVTVGREGCWVHGVCILIQNLS